ncbi:hypothetical protein [Ornithinimicrobium kibberense]|uniref:hypothetical protein n=1 Tax=Ornithinimicrobium kibberense TaxID=282060 RepID=UPI00361F03DC
MSIAEGPTTPIRCLVARESLHRPAKTAELNFPCPVGCNSVRNMSCRPASTSTPPVTVRTTGIITALPRAQPAALTGPSRGPLRSLAHHRSSTSGAPFVTARPRDPIGRGDGTTVGPHGSDTRLPAP